MSRAKALFGQDSNSTSSGDGNPTVTNPTSSTIASSLPQYPSISSQHSSSSSSSNQFYNRTDSSSALLVNNLLSQQQQQERLILQQQYSQSALFQQQQQQQQFLQQQQQYPLSTSSSSSALLPPPSSHHLAPSPSSSSVSLGPSLISDPDGKDHSVHPSVVEPNRSSSQQQQQQQLEDSHYAPDGLSWLQKSSLQQSPVTVYYSKDPLSNLQIRVLLRRQPDEASAHANPKTWKQMSLAVKEKQRREEEKEREEALKRESTIAGHTTTGALATTAQSSASNINEGDLPANTGESMNDVDEKGRRVLSPNPDTIYTPAIITSQIFSWQQKVVSPTEILLAAMKKKSASSYADQVLHILRDRYPETDPLEASARNLIVSLSRDGMMIHSKRDHDRYIDPDERHKHVTTSRENRMTPLAERIVMAPLVSKRSESHLTREGNSIPFHILATVNLPSEPQSITLLYENHNDSDPRPPVIQGSFQKPLAVLHASEGDEYVTLEMRPPFSPPQKDKSRFDDAEWYSFYTPSGEHYRYRLENFSGVIEERDEELASKASNAQLNKSQPSAYIALEEYKVEAELARMAMHDMMVAKHRSGREFDTGPPRGYESFHLMGEIVKTTGFEDEDELSLSYELDLRNDNQGYDHHAEGTIGKQDVWTVQQPAVLEAITQRSHAIFSLDPNVPSKDSLFPSQRECYFSFPFEFKLLKKIAQLSSPPILYLQVHALSRWGIHRVIGYAYVHLPLSAAGEHELEVECWVPQGSLRDQKKEFFLGVGPTLRDVRLCGIPEDKVKQKSNMLLSGKRELIHGGFGLCFSFINSYSSLLLFFFLLHPLFFSSVCLESLRLVQSCHRSYPPPFQPHSHPPRRSQNTLPTEGRGH